MGAQEKQKARDRRTQELMFIVDDMRKAAAAGDAKAMRELQTRLTEARIEGEEARTEYTKARATAAGVQKPKTLLSPVDMTSKASVATGGTVSSPEQAVAWWGGQLGPEAVDSFFPRVDEPYKSQNRATVAALIRKNPGTVSKEAWGQWFPGETHPAYARVSPAPTTTPGTAPISGGMNAWNTQQLRDFIDAVDAKNDAYTAKRLGITSQSPLFGANRKGLLAIRANAEDILRRKYTEEQQAASSEEMKSGEAKRDAAADKRERRAEARLNYTTGLESIRQYFAAGEQPPPEIIASTQEAATALGIKTSVQTLVGGIAAKAKKGGASPQITMNTIIAAEKSRETQISSAEKKARSEWKKFPVDKKDRVSKSYGVKYSPMNDADYEDMYAAYKRGEAEVQFDKSGAGKILKNWGINYESGRAVPIGAPPRGPGPLPFADTASMLGAAGAPGTPPSPERAAPKKAVPRKPAAPAQKRGGGKRRGTSSAYESSRSALNAGVDRAQYVKDVARSNGISENEAARVTLSGWRKAWGEKYPNKKR